MRPRTPMSAAERADLLRAPTLTLLENANVFGMGLTGLRDSMRRGEIDLQEIRLGTRVVIPTAVVRKLIGMDEIQVPVDEATP